jgi:hypothetical protein
LPDSGKPVNETAITVTIRFWGWPTSGNTAGSAPGAPDKSNIFASLIVSTTAGEGVGGRGKNLSFPYELFDAKLFSFNHYYLIWHYSLPNRLPLSQAG